MLAQRLCQPSRNRDGADAASALRSIDLASADSAADVDDAFVTIPIKPLRCKQFTPAHARRCRSRHQEPVFPCQPFDKPPCLLGPQNDLLGPLMGAGAS